MKKTGKYIHLLSILFVLLFGWSSLSLADDYQVRLSVSDSQIMVGEQIRVTVEVTADQSVNVTRPSPQNIDGFRYRSTTPSTSTSYSIVNGVATLSYGYGFIIVAQEEGTFEIPAFEVMVEGELYRTNSATVTVHSRSDRQQGAISQRPEIYIDMELSVDKPYTGQQIIADVVLYFRDNIEINSFQVTRGWSTEGFWQEDLSRNHSTRAETIFLDGVRYRRAVLMRHAIFPTRHGELTLNPYYIRASIRTSNRGMDRDGSMFAQGFGRSRSIDLQTNETKVQVSPLPRPSRGQFINAIGELEIRRYLDQEQILLGESVEIITEISGRGNLNLISRPRHQTPDQDFDVFRPQETIELEKTATHIQGTKVFRDVMIARNVSSYTIPAETIAYYDDKAGRYRYVELPELPLRVIRDPNDRVGFVSSGDVRLHPITGLAQWTSSTRKTQHYPTWFWLGILIPFLVLGITYYYVGYQRRLASDSKFARFQKAKLRAGEKLDQAREAVEQNQLKAAYSYIHQSLYGFISDRLYLAEAGMSDKEIVAHLREKGLAQSEIDMAFKILDKCSGIRFAPVSGSDDVLHDIDLTEKLITKLQKETA